MLVSLSRLPFYGAAARATAKPASKGTARSLPGAALTTATIPEPPPVVACLAAAYDVLVLEAVGNPVTYVVRLIALDAALGGSASGQLALLEALTEHGISEEALARAAATATLFRAHSYRFFATEDLVRLSIQPA